MKKEQITGEVRLNKYLSDAGVCSRREADRMIESKKVRVDGVLAQPGMKITSGQEVTVNGKPVEREEELVLLAVHKPRGVVCTTDTRWNDQTIYDLLKYPKRIFSIGRLDKDSEGLLLMTNQGDILNKIMRAGNYHEKEYLVTVNKEITTEFLKKMSEGVYLKELEVKTRPCKVALAGPKQFRIILTQGLNRQIRRMCEACHFEVTRLIRTRVMNIELGNLAPGAYRAVSRKEYGNLLAALRDSSNLSYQDTVKETTDQKKNPKEINPKAANNKSVNPKAVNNKTVNSKTVNNKAASAKTVKNKAAKNYRVDHKK